MEKLRLLFQHLQSSSESVMNGVCLLLAAGTVKLYSSLDFHCPCLAHYNAAYGLGLLLAPPLALFLCGLLANRQSVLMVEEWRRPAGRRQKDPGMIRCDPKHPAPQGPCHGGSRRQSLSSAPRCPPARYMCSSVLQRALAAPVVWILLALLDGKCLVCAFSSSVDPEKFPDFANMTSSQVQLFLAKVACKDDELVRDSPARKAVARYLRCLSQVTQPGPGGLGGLSRDRDMLEILSHRQGAGGSWGWGPSHSGQGGAQVLCRPGGEQVSTLNCAPGRRWWQVLRGHSSMFGAWVQT